MTAPSTYAGESPGALARMAPARALGAFAGALRRDPFLAIALPTLLLLGLWHLDRYPRSWFDEGMYLQVGKNFAREGLYAVRSADGAIDYAPIVGVGPTVLLPVALALALGGMSLEVARLVPVLVLVAATGGLYLIARALFGRLAAGCTLLLLLTLPAIEWLATGRQVLGEVPAIGLLLTGGALACRARSSLPTTVAGIVLGLTMVTKGQYLVVLPVAMVAIALVDRLDTRRRPLLWHGWLLGVALATYAGWTVALLSLLGDGQIAENWGHLRAASGGAVLIFDRDRLLAGVKFLLGPRGFLLIVPATLAGLWAWRQAAGSRRLALAALWIFQTTWLGWFACASIAWPRYAFPGLVVNTIFMVYLVARLIDGLPAALARPERRTPATFVGAALALLLAALIAREAWQAVAPIAGADGRDPQRFAAAVETLVPAGAAIDAWEPEVGFLVDRPFQYPPQGSLNRAVRSRWLGQGEQPRAVEEGVGAVTATTATTPLRGEYLILGPFARWVGLYNEAATSPRYILIARVGEYELYRRGADAAPATGRP